jgi:hypothetical protein
MGRGMATPSVAVEGSDRDKKDRYCRYLAWHGFYLNAAGSWSLSETLLYRPLCCCFFSFNFYKPYIYGYFLFSKNMGDKHRPWDSKGPWAMRCIDAVMKN